MGTFRKINMTLMKPILALFFAVFATASDRGHDRHINPNCGDYGTAIECEDACQDVNFKCIINCNGDGQCVSACTRTFTNCLDNCPCHINCYEGCPCPNDNDFCVIHCHDKFKDEYDVCHNDLRAQLFKCEDDCGPFNPECEHQCFVNYENQMKNCPCMDNCPEGCPCPAFDCGGGTTPTAPGSTTTATTSAATTTPSPVFGNFTNGVLVTQGKWMNGDCYENQWNRNQGLRAVYDDKVGFIQTSWSQTIESCKDSCNTTVGTGPDQYDYAILVQNTCWCGIMEPFEEKVAQCRFPCGGNHEELCGGPNGEASFHSIAHKEQLCHYGTEESFDGTFNVTTITTDNPYAEIYQHCWSRFTCPNGFQAQVYFDYLDTEWTPDFVLLTSSAAAYKYGGRTGTEASEHYPTLYEWLPMNGDVLDVQFRCDGSVSYEGFKIRLRCERN